MHKMFVNEGFRAYWKGILPPVCTETLKRAWKVSTVGNQFAQELELNIETKQTFFSVFHFFRIPTIVSIWIEPCNASGNTIFIQLWIYFSISLSSTFCRKQSYTCNNLFTDIFLRRILRWRHRRDFGEPFWSGKSANAVESQTHERISHHQTSVERSHTPARFRFQRTLERSLSYGHAKWDFQQFLFRFLPFHFELNVRR